MRVKGIVWLGTRTPRFVEIRKFLGRIAGEPHIDDDRLRSLGVSALR